MAIAQVDIPNWLETLLSESFFTPCLEHQACKKNEKKIFCLDCCCSLCCHCIRHHPHHSFLQIRRYVYQDVVRLLDIQKLLDCGDVQCYVANNSRVIFLNVRPQSRAFRGSNNNCRTCLRPVQPPGRYCCISCKIGRIVERPVRGQRLQRERVWLAVEAPKRDGEGHEAPVTNTREPVSASDDSSPDCDRSCGRTELAGTRRGEEVKSSGTRKKQWTAAASAGPSTSSRRVAGRAGGGSAPVRKSRRKSSVPARAPFF